MKVFFFTSKKNKSVIAIVAEHASDAINILDERIDLDNSDYIGKGGMNVITNTFKQILID